MTVTELTSPLMDETAQAPTLEAETQSIHAWSQADDGEAITEYIPRHSWKIPTVVAIVAAAAAIGAGVFLAWPQSATKPLVAPSAPQVALTPSPPVQTQSPDERFLALDRQRLTLISPKLALNAAHDVCVQHQQGVFDPQIAQGILAGTPGLDLRSASIFVDIAREVYCP